MILPTSPVFKLSTTSPTLKIFYQQSAHGDFSNQTWEQSHILHPSLISIAARILL